MKKNNAQKPCPYRLRSCVWELTLRCCFSCKYCGSRAGRARENELTTAECLSVAEQLAREGCRRVSLIGGEVFLRPDWAVIVRALTERGIRVTVITNGFLLTADILRTLRHLAIESVAVSLDGTEAVHDAYRQPGSYRRAMAALFALKNAGIPASVITTLHRDNVNTLPGMANALHDSGIFAWQLQACSPMGNASKGICTAFSFEAVLRFAASYSPLLPFRVLLADNIGYFPAEKLPISGAPVSFCGCAAGLSTIGIDSVGNVRGCESMYDESFIEGNLRERTLHDIWNHEDSFAYNRRFSREMLTGPCAECPHSARCAGGCRSYNFFSGGKLYESSRCIHCVK